MTDYNENFGTVSHGFALTFNVHRDYNLGKCLTIRMNNILGLIGSRKRLEKDRQVGHPLIGLSIAVYNFAVLLPVLVLCMYCNTNCQIVKMPFSLYRNC
jgi:hypothetical protein